MRCTWHIYAVLVSLARLQHAWEAGLQLLTGHQVIAAIRVAVVHILRLEVAPVDGAACARTPVSQAEDWRRDMDAEDVTSAGSYRAFCHG